MVIRVTASFISGITINITKENKVFFTAMVWKIFKYL